MSLIPEPFINELLERTDIVALISARVPLKRQGSNYMARCPFHTEKTPSFSVNPAKQFYHCFGCGESGDAIRFLMRHEGLAFREAIESLATDAGMEIPQAENERGVTPEHRKQHETLYAALAKAAEYYYAQLRHSPEAIEYLKQRGLTGQIARTFQIGYAPKGWDALYKALGSAFDVHILLTAGLLGERPQGGYYDRFVDRIMFPIRDGRGRVIGFGGRSLGQNSPKYLNSPETPVFHKGRALYGLFEARQAQGRLSQLVVVEGYLDVIALAQFGLPYAVATQGTATTAEQLTLLFRHSPRIVFCFDGDAAGKKAAWRALEHTLPVMQDHREAAFLFLPPGDDPDSWIRREGLAAFEHLLQQAMLLSEFLIRELSQRHALNSAEGRAQLVREAARLMALMPEGLLKAQLLTELSRLTAIARDTVAHYVSQTPPPPQMPTAPHTASPPRTSKLPSPQVMQTPVRIALALLLQSPPLALRVEDPARLQNPDIPGSVLLSEVIQRIQQSPQLQGPELLQQYQSHPDGPHLQKLAQWSIPTDSPTAHARLFDDAIRRIQQRHRDLHTQRLLSRAAEHPLTPEEKKTLALLLRPR
ncbi:DNA primase [Thiorhodospira sibirica]|uniref:DNA primase n=1 Tax=Thiorhodospira sibirica TaxID=154347 RepID=UPI00022C22C6|nr:DNA primase [Thiorhodospira sibirica]